MKLFAYLVSMPLLVMGGGFHISVHDSFSMARGNAVGGNIDQPSSIYYNPAGLSRIHTPAFSAGIYAIQLDIEATIGSGTIPSKTELQYVPHFYLAYPLTENLTSGLSLTVPFGLSSKWDTAPITSFATKNSVENLVYSLALSYKVSDQLRVGGTLDFHNIEFELGRQLPNNRQDFQIKGEDHALGFSLGVQYAPAPHHQLGLTYRRAPQLDLKGTQSFTTPPIQIKGIKLPDTASLSYNYVPNEHWDFGTSIEWINWDELNHYTSNGNPPAPVEFDWETSFMYAVGVTYYTANKWNYSAGYVYNQNAQPDSHTYTPAVSDANRHWLSGGIGKTWEHLSLQCAYHYGFSERTTRNAHPLLNGEYKTSAHGFMITSQYTF